MTGSSADPDEKKHPAIFTIGHSTRPVDEFVEILKVHGVECVIDIRTIPKSKYNPQYNSDALAASLRKNDIGYEHMPGLGGLRHAKKDSVNTGWRNASFRGFADYMQTDEFKKGLAGLIEASRKQTCVLMCAEAAPWRCHRSLIADALLVRGFTVVHLMSKTSSKIHMLTPWAEVGGKTITYPKPPAASNPGT